MRCQGRQVAVARQVSHARKRLAGDQGPGFGGLLSAARVQAAVAAERVTFRECL